MCVYKYARAYPYECGVVAYIFTVGFRFPFVRLQFSRENQRCVPFCGRNHFLCLFCVRKFLNALTPLQNVVFNGILPPPHYHEWPHFSSFRTHTVPHTSSAKRIPSMRHKRFTFNRLFFLANNSCNASTDTALCQSTRCSIRNSLLIIYLIARNKCLKFR